MDGVVHHDEPKTLRNSHAKLRLFERKICYAHHLLQICASNSAQQQNDHRLPFLYRHFAKAAITKTYAANLLINQLNGYLVELSIDIAFQSTPRPRWQRFQDYRTRLT